MGAHIPLEDAVKVRILKGQQYDKLQNGEIARWRDNYLKGAR